MCSKNRRLKKIICLGKCMLRKSYPRTTAHLLVVSVMLGQSHKLLDCVDDAAGVARDLCYSFQEVFQALSLLAVDLNLRAFMLFLAQVFSLQGCLLLQGCNGLPEPLHSI